VAKTFKFEVVTPEKVFYSDEVNMIVFNRSDGEMGVMADHMPMVVAMEIGTLKITKGEETFIAAVSQGFVEITEAGVTVIVDSAEWPEDIDVDRANNSMKVAEEKLLEYRNNKKMEILLKASIQRAKNRIKIANNQ
jgi:F-type H+-transporting ATPase subunit epsilon